MSSPLPRRWPAKVARESAALDRLSGGRLTLGVGICEDRCATELSLTGEQLDDRLRGEMLDEALVILTAAWSGEPVRHLGKHYTVDGMQFLPRPAQRPRRRAARIDDFFPAHLKHPDELAEIATALTDLRPPAARTTSPSGCPSASTRPPTPAQAPPGGCLSSRPRTSRWTPCEACSVTAPCRPDRRPDALLATAANGCAGDSVPDIGCGTGRPTATPATGKPGAWTRPRTGPPAAGGPRPRACATSTSRYRDVTDHRRRRRRRDFSSPEARPPAASPR